MSTESVLAEVLVERVRQENRCAKKRRKGKAFYSCANLDMPQELKLAILTEEVGEVARELCDASHERKAPDRNLRVELIQVAAIAVAWAESL